MTDSPPASAGSKLDAQRRADRVAAFRGEVAALEREGVLALSEEQRSRVATHHEALLRELAARFDVDVSEGEKQLSLGMRIASLLGALALAASAFFFIRRFWGTLSTPSQVAILAAAPALGLLATAYAARKERSGYFAALAGLVAFACFVIDVSTGLALIAVTNGWILLDVARNRSGEPEARVELTERELWLPWSVQDDDEDSGLALTLAWNGDNPFGSGRPTWLDRDKLRELGFDVHVAPESPGSERFYSNVPAREAFVVLEMEGEAWSRELARREEEIRRCRQSGSCGPAKGGASVAEQVAELRRTESHLVAVDAGRDPRALRRRYGGQRYEPWPGFLILANQEPGLGRPPGGAVLNRSGGARRRRQPATAPGSWRPTRRSSE